MRWPNENAYDAQLAPVCAAAGVPLALAKAVCAHESGFNPRARRAEAPRASLPPTPDFPEGGDESRGLMQLLVRTARGLGYRGTVDGLYDPATNVRLGCMLLGDALRAAARRGLDERAALSEYNGGYRPSLGFGAPLPNGRFGNQAYVDAVMEKLRYFSAAAAPDFSDVTATHGSTAPGGSAAGGAAGLTVASLAAAALLLGRLK